MKVVADRIDSFGGWFCVEKQLSDDLSKALPFQASFAREEQEYYGGVEDEIFF
jgi:hypothetical protein